MVFLKTKVLFCSKSVYKPMRVRNSSFWEYLDEHFAYLFQSGRRLGFSCLKSGLVSIIVRLKLLTSPEKKSRIEGSVFFVRAGVFN